MHELHMIAGAITDTWPAILLGLASLAYIVKCRRKERLARESRQRIARELKRSDEIQRTQKMWESLPVTAAKNDQTWKKAFGSTR